MTVTAKVDAPITVNPETPGLLLAHGAGNDLDHPLLASVAAALADQGVAIVIRFNFPYMERGRTSPDPQSMLETTYRRAHDLMVDELLEPGAQVFLGGKSLGGRIAAELVSRRHEGKGCRLPGSWSWDILCMHRAGRTICICNPYGGSAFRACSALAAGIRSATPTCYDRCSPG